jgi:hypothetical protein
MYYTRVNGIDEPESVVVRSLDGDIVADHRFERVNGKVIPTERALYVGTNDRLLALQEPTEGDGSGDDGSEDGDEPERSDGGNAGGSGSDDSDGSDETTEPDVDDDC